jgi:hypothetical protein
MDIDVDTTPPRMHSEAGEMSNHDTSLTAAELVEISMDPDTEDDD